MSVVIWTVVIYGIALAVVGTWATLRAIKRCHRCRNPKFHCYCAEGSLR